MTTATMDRTEMWEDCRERAARGAALLDEKRPGWAEEIDIENLSMVTPCKCVLGQIYDGYYKGWAELVNEGHDALGERATELGFVAQDYLPKEYELRDAEWKMLGVVWESEVMARR